MDFHNTEQHSYRQGFHGQHLGTGLDDEGRIEPIVEFDHAAVDRNLGLATRADVEAEARHQAFEDAGSALGQILAWFADARDLSSMGLRAAALLVAVRPDLVRQGRRTQADLARWFGVTRAAISKLVSQIHRMSNGRFAHGGNCLSAAQRQMARLKALRVHALRRAQAHAPRKRRRPRGVSGYRARGKTPYKRF